MGRRTRYDHVYLSPHLDDVVLSCGGRIWQQTQAEAPVLVITVFAGSPAPSAPLSPFAQTLHARWGNPADAVAARRREDRAALSALGAEAAHWPYADCIYRQAPDGAFPYASEDALWGPIHPAEQRLIEELAARMRDLAANEGTLYAPLAVGRHVDHRIVRQAAERAEKGLIYYEDFPYAEDRAAVAAALEPSAGAWRQERVALSPQALEAKIAAIACYRSQVSTFWEAEDAMASHVRAFAERVGEDGPAERYWRLPEED